MNSKQKFQNFLDSLKGKGQDVLIESVKKGFQVCFENYEYSSEYPSEITDSSDFRKQNPNSVGFSTGGDTHDSIEEVMNKYGYVNGKDYVLVYVEDMSEEPHIVLADRTMLNNEEFKKELYYVAEF